MWAFTSSPPRGAPRDARRIACAPRTVTSPPSSFFAPPKSLRPRSTNRQPFAVSRRLGFEPSPIRAEVAQPLGGVPETMKHGPMSPVHGECHIEKEALVDNLAIEASEPGGWGLFLKPDRHVSAGEVIARVPLHDALVIEQRYGKIFSTSADGNALDNHAVPADWVSAEWWHRADWDCKLACLLLFHAFFLGEDSKWNWYISMLPGADELFTAADLSGCDLVQLQYAPLMELVDVHQFRLELEYDRLRNAMPPEQRPLVSKRRFDWAMKIVHSRAFSIPPGGFAASSTRQGLKSPATGVRSDVCAEWPRMFALVPILDMTNHGQEAERLAKFRFDDKSRCFELVASQGFVSASGNADTTEASQENGQIVVSYGDLSNDDMFLLYGFVQPSNPNDYFQVEDVDDWVAEMPLGIKSHHSRCDSGTLLDDKLLLLEKVNLHYEGRKFYLSRDTVDPELLAALRILVASPAEYGLATSFLRTYVRQVQDVPGSSFNEMTCVKKVIPREWLTPVTRNNEYNVWSLLERQCERLLDEFDTSLEADEELLACRAGCSSWDLAAFGPRDKAMNAVLLFRAEKKRILREVAKVAGRHRRTWEGCEDVCDGCEFASPVAVSY